MSNSIFINLVKLAYHNQIMKEVEENILNDAEESSESMYKKFV